jgi:predicted ATP-dependent endonuclease of OLD family
VSTSVLSGIKLNNFRAFTAPTDIPLKQITLLFGQNSAGKSSIIKSLLLLQQSFSNRATRRNQPFVFSGDSVDLGSFSSVISNHQTQRKFTMGVTVASSASTTSSLVGDQSFSIEWTVNKEQSKVAIQIEVAGRNFQFKSAHQDETSYFVLEPESISDFIQLFDENDLLTDGDPIIRDLISGDGWRPCFRFGVGGLLPGNLVGVERAGQLHLLQDETLASHFDDSNAITRPSRLQATWNQNMLRMRDRLSSKLSDIAYIGPLRQEPQRFGRYSPTDDSDVGSSGENMLSALFSDKKLVMRVNNFLAEMKMPYRIKIHQLESQETLGFVIHMSLVNKNTNIELAPTDVGVGYSQVLPLITQAALSRGSLVCVEQPELHLHPAMQARIADVFIDAAMGGSNVQFLIETHSESLMLRFLRRIREGTLNPESIQVLYVDQDSEGASHIHELPISPSGEFLAEWPNGFFDDRLEELGW